MKYLYKKGTEAVPNHYPWSNIWHKNTPYIAPQQPGQKFSICPMMLIIDNDMSKVVSHEKWALSDRLSVNDDDDE